jgi:hypothetical protein
MNLTTFMIFKGSTVSNYLHSMNVVVLHRFGISDGRLQTCLFPSLCMAPPMVIGVSRGSPNFSFFSEPNHQS